MERPELQKICRQCERDPVIMRTRTHTAEGQPCPSDVPNTTYYHRINTRSSIRAVLRCSLVF